MDIHPYLIQSRSELGSKSYLFVENDKIISLTNLFQHLVSAEILSEWKIEFILPYLVRNFQISAWNKLTAKCLLNILPLYKALSWIWQLSLCKKLGSHIFYSLVYKFNVCFIRLENLVYQNNPFIIYTTGQSSIQHTTLNQLNITKQIFLNRYHFPST